MNAGISIFDRVRCLPIALVLLAACASGTEPEIYAWEGELVGTPGNPLNGNVAVISQFGRTEVSIQIEGGEPAATYAWRINEGTCAQEGDLLGGAASYPDLETNGEGTATANNTLAGSLRPDGGFAARVLADAVVSACGELRQVR